LKGASRNLTRGNAIVDFPGYQIPVTQQLGMQTRNIGGLHYIKLQNGSKVWAWPVWRP